MILNLGMKKLNFKIILNTGWIGYNLNMSEYKSPMRTSYRKPIVIDSNDPRVQTKFDIEKYRSRAGAEIIIKNRKKQNIELEEYVPWKNINLQSERHIENIFI